MGQRASSDEHICDGGDDPLRPCVHQDDPTRTNYCELDWSDAVVNCSDDDNWWPGGTDEECPEGKLCFAGTDCKYVSDLVPTGAPALPPSVPPTQSPVIYGAVENTRLFGRGWEDVRTTCRIGSHCPSGSAEDCPPGQDCLGWISGCNILDFQEHWKETGQEIHGPDNYPGDQEGCGEDTQQDRKQRPCHDQDGRLVRVSVHSRSCRDLHRPRAQHGLDNSY